MSALTRWGFDRAAGAKARPVPLVRAYRGPYPDLSSRTMAEVMRDEALAGKEAGPRIKSGVTKEVEGRRAKAGGEAQGGRTGEPCVEPVSRPAAGRTAAATSEVMDVTAGETAPVQKKAKPRIKSGATVEESKQVGAMPPLPASVPVAVDRAPLLTTPSPVRASKILIADKPSSMEAAAQQWQRPAEPRGALPPVPGEDGKVWCAGCDARVPAWFGRDCISAACSLKGSQ